VRELSGVADKYVTILIGGMRMDIREELRKASEAGLPIAAVAKEVGIDPSMLQKWVKGTRNLKEDKQQWVAKELLRRKALWDNIMVE
jgi:transcriptional regulator with XRE-family HTH domain